MTETCPSTTSGATRRGEEERTRTERERGRRARRQRRSPGPGPVLGKTTEPEFFKLLRSPRIDSKKPIQLGYVA